MVGLKQPVLVRAELFQFSFEKLRLLPSNGLLVQYENI